MLFWHRENEAQGLKTGNSRVVALPCNSVYLQHYNAVIVKDSVPNEMLLLKKNIVVAGFTKLHNESIIICFLKER